MRFKQFHNKTNAFHKPINANLWFHIHQSDSPLLVDLLDGLDFGAKHISLKASVLQQLIPRDGLGHGFVGDEVIFLSILLILTLGSGGVCVESNLKN